MGGPAALPAVKTQLGITDNRDDARLSDIIAAVNSEVRCWPVASRSIGLVSWYPSTALGSTLLAARLFRRKNSPAGVEAFGTGGAAYVMRNDPDIAMMLKLGSWSGPQLG